ncbi:MAG: mandelate racemase/muconate lactonizing enzyme family protein, partial [Chloroflexota bacterium]|nr:mandelate racemase/muconate lactonizing enzyme family protein [Chloroflexota bacterium]
MAKIETLSACAVCVPLDRPTSFATRDVVARDYALVEVATDDGERGIGFCYAGSTGGTLVAAAVRELLTPLVVGR